MKMRRRIVLFVFGILLSLGVVYLMTKAGYKSYIVILSGVSLIIAWTGLEILDIQLGRRVAKILKEIQEEEGEHCNE